MQPATPVKKVRKRRMEMADVELDAGGFDPSALDVPELSEKRIVELGAGVHKAHDMVPRDVTCTRMLPLPGPNAVKVTDAALLETLAPPASRGPKGSRQGPRAAQAFAATTGEDTRLTLRAMYRRWHATGLRSHEELATNLVVNLADVVHTERVLADELDDGPAAKGDVMRAAAELPMLGRYLLRLATLDGLAMRALFCTEGPNDANEIKTVNSRAALVAKLRLLVREQESEKAAQTSEGVKGLGGCSPVAEIAKALHTRRREDLVRWSGTTALLLASVAHMHKTLLRFAAAEAEERRRDRSPSPMLSPTLSSATLGTPDAKPKRMGRRKSVADLSATLNTSHNSSDEPQVTTLTLTHTLRYEAAPAARAALQNALISLESGTKVDAPPLLLYTVAASLDEVDEQLHAMPAAAASATAAKDKQAPPRPVYGQQPSEAQVKAEKAAEKCAAFDWADNECCNVTLVVHAPSNAIVPLAPFAICRAAGDLIQASTGAAGTSPSGSTAPSDFPGGSFASRRVSSQAAAATPAAADRLSPIALPLGDLTIVDVNVAKRRILATFAPIPAEQLVEFHNFFDGVLVDARKADQVASSIHGRLAQTFVRPHHCARHTQQRFAFFCNNCRAFICATCRAERHAHHSTTALAAFCAEVKYGLQPKRDIIERRLDCLQHLYDGVVVEEQRMHELVDKSINDVLERVRARQRALHDDADARCADQRRRIDAECQLCEADRKQLDGALAVVQGARHGDVKPVPTVKTHELSIVRDALGPRLPVKALKLLVKVLMWSNPSQYLTQQIYPPLGSAAAAGGAASPGSPSLTDTAPASPRGKPPPAPNANTTVATVASASLSASTSKEGTSSSSSFTPKRVQRRIAASGQTVAGSGAAAVATSAK